MIKNNVFLLVILVIFSCQSIEKPAEPETVLDEDKMVEILTDIAFVKAAKTSYRKVLEQKKINPEAYILQKHGIDSLVFEQNNIWYSGQLETYEKIFKRVKANLEKSRDKYEVLKKKEDSIKKVRDSIKKIKDTLDVKEKPLKGDKGILEEIESAQKKRTKNPEEE